jgi:hypothetical protein
MPLPQWKHIPETTGGLEVSFRESKLQKLRNSIHLVSIASLAHLYFGNYGICGLWGRHGTSVHLQRLGNYQLQRLGNYLKDVSSTIPIRLWCPQLKSWFINPIQTPFTRLIDW